MGASIFVLITMFLHSFEHYALYITYETMINDCSMLNLKILSFEDVMEIFL